MDNRERRQAADLWRGRLSLFAVNSQEYPEPVKRVIAISNIAAEIDTPHSYSPYSFTFLALFYGKPTLAPKHTVITNDVSFFLELSKPLEPLSSVFSPFQKSRANFQAIRGGICACESGDKNRLCAGNFISSIQ